MKSRMIQKIKNAKKVVTPFDGGHSRRISGREYFLLMKRHSVKETRGYKVVLLGDAFNAHRSVEISMPDGYTNKVHKLAMKITRRLFNGWGRFYDPVTFEAL